MLSLEIGGLVTNMHTSFLQDTSPPSSICSSMNNERMSNSLISSADFTNLNFLQATNSLETEDASNLTEINTTAIIATGAAPAGDEIQYTLSDMIRDRKALESLTMSGDGTLIKDSQIGQIDDISLATLSKTASGCSTMDNSTDSVSTCPNEQQPMPELRGLRTTMLLGEEMIGDTIISLVDSLTSPTTAATVGGAATPTAESTHNATFKRPPVPIHNETLLLAGRQANTTYTEGCDTPEEATRCETPENIERSLSVLQMESTPLTTASARFQHHTNNNNNANMTNNNNKPWSYTPTLKGRGEINISPIVNGGGSTIGATTTPLRSRTSRMNQTYDQSPAMLKEVQAEVAPTAATASNTFIADTLELLEQIEQPQMDLTYDMSEEQKQMQCILDLAEAEVELLAQQEGDEEQFEQMLTELGKVNSLNAEQLKMQKSLESIKRRFHKEDEQHVDQNQQHQHQQQQQEIEHVQHVTPTSGNQTMLLGSHSQSTSSGSGSGERLLSRRSRLYDDVNLSAMHDSNISGLSNISCNSKSFIVHRREEEPATHGEACTPLQEEEQGQEQQTEPAATSYKLAERRERDRERFKTIKITKEMRARDEKLDNIVVPCIDDEIGTEVEPQIAERQQSPPGRLSRRDQTESSNVGPSNNYLTYKKPKEKSLLMRHQQQQQQQPQDADLTTVESNHGQSQIARSLSRPRYISGLQKFTTVSKATSAGAGLNATTTASSGATATPAATVELKSPMGIKSKSFHNLSSNISGIAGPSSIMAPRPSLGGGGLRRPSVQAASNRVPQQQEVRSVFEIESKNQLIFFLAQQLNDTSTFKVPKLISGLRAPNTMTSVKRAMGNGLARPSSGYYSMKAAGESETPEVCNS